MRRNRCYSVLILLVLLCGGSAFASVSLPDIPGYTAGVLRSTPLSAPSGDFGVWLSRTYRSPGGRILEATLMSGPGAGPLVAGAEGSKTNDRPLGFGATYEVFSLDGKTAVYETIPSVGQSLAVAVDTNSTITLESASLGRKELEEAALHLIRAM